MAAGRHSSGAPVLVTSTDQPLIGITFIENGQGVTRYLATEADAEAAIAGARSLAGAWSDLDWQATVDELDRIRHGRTPTTSSDDL